MIVEEYMKSILMDTEKNKNIELIEKTFKKIPSSACYGERWFINEKYQDILNLFKTISVWGGATDKEVEKDLSYSYMFELPFGQKIEDNPLLISWIVKKINEKGNI